MVSGSAFSAAPVKWVQQVMDPYNQKIIGITKLSEREQLALGAFLVKAMTASQKSAHKSTPDALTDDERAEIRKSDCGGLLLMTTEKLGEEKLRECGLTKLTVAEFKHLGIYFAVLMESARKQGFEDGVKAANSADHYTPKKQDLLDE